MAEHAQMASAGQPAIAILLEAEETSPCIWLWVSSNQGPFLAMVPSAANQLWNCFLGFAERMALVNLERSVLRMEAEDV